MVRYLGSEELLVESQEQSSMLTESHIHDNALSTSSRKPGGDIGGIAPS